MKHLATKAKADIASIRRVVKNFIEFLDAVCLLAVSAFAIIQSLHHRDQWLYRGLLFAALVIELQALLLLVRHFNRPNN